MVINYSHVKYRLGDIETNIGAGSNLIVNEMIADAYSFVNQYTGSVTGQIIDSAAADYAAAKVVDTMMGKDSKVISADFMNLSTNLKNSCMDKIKERGRKGYVAITEH